MDWIRTQAAFRHARPSSPAPPSVVGCGRHPRHFWEGCSCMDTRSPDRSMSNFLLSLFFSFDNREKFQFQIRKLYSATPAPHSLSRHDPRSLSLRALVEVEEAPMARVLRRRDHPSLLFGSDGEVVGPFLFFLDLSSPETTTTTTTTVARVPMSSSPSPSQLRRI